MRHDLSFAIRRLLQAPAFTVFAVVTLALGIGATTAIYSVIYAVMLRPMDVPEADRLVNIYHSPLTGVAGASLPTIGFSLPDYQDLRSNQTSFSALSAWWRFREVVVASGVGAVVTGEIVGGDYFSMLGVMPLSGRLIRPEDDRPGAPPVVVISEDFWRRHFGADPGAVGRTVKIRDGVFEVIGVAPAQFRGVDIPNLMATPMWIPLSSGVDFPESGPEIAQDRGRRWLLVKARLKPGVSFDHAAAEVAAIAAGVDAATPLPPDDSPQSRNQPGTPTRRWTVIPTTDILLHESVQAVAAPMAWTAMVAVGLVLMVACTNLANLLLARSAGRRHDTAVRLAMGASRARLLREQLVESATLAVAGALGAALVARGVMTWLTAEISVGRAFVMNITPVVHPSVLAVAAAATLLSLLVFGVMPAFASTRVDVRELLARDTAGSTPRWRGRRVLIAGQVAVSVLLVAVAALCVGQIRAAAHHDFGMDLDRVAIVQLDFAKQTYDEPRARQTADTLAAEARLLPGVQAVALSSSLPSGADGPRVGIASAEVGLSSNPRAWLVARQVIGSPEIFQVLGVRLLRGRGFMPADSSSAPRVAVISQATAKRVFGDSDPLGRRIVMRGGRAAGKSADPDTRLVVGISADVDTGPINRFSAGVVFVPFAQRYEPTMSVVARAGEPASLVGSLRSMTARVDPELAIIDAGTGVSLAGSTNLMIQVMAGLSGLLGMLALILAMAGLNGVLSHVVAGRTREVGLRIALGADHRRIIRTILLDGASPVVAGIVFGLTLGAIVRLAMRPLFVRLLPAMDVAVLAIIPVLFVASALVACYLPARRAARVDPNVALRHL
jgi:putative ABC transport system permease protein